MAKMTDSPYPPECQALAERPQNRITNLERLVLNLSERLAACSECLGRAAERRKGMMEKNWSLTRSEGEVTCTFSLRSVHYSDTMGSEGITPIYVHHLDLTILNPPEKFAHLGVAQSLLERAASLWGIKAGRCVIISEK